MNIFPITDSYANCITLWIGILGIVCFIIKKKSFDNIKMPPLFIILSLFLAFFSTLYYFPFLQDIEIFEIVKLLCVYICYSFSFYYIIIFLCKFTVLQNTKYKNTKYKNTPYWRKVLILGLIWLPNILIQYPASFCPDSISQLEQALGYVKMSAHHPIVHTYLIGVCLKIGKVVFKSYNIGIFGYVLIQYFIMLLIFAYMIHYLEKIGTKRTYTNLLWIITGVCPLIVAYTGTVLKDVIYSAFVAWFVICCVKYIHNFYINTSLMIGIMVSAIGAILFRHNGIYVILPTCIALVVVALIKRFCLETILKCVLIILVPITFSNTLTTALVNYNNITLGSEREMYSLCFQQTARTIIEHEGELVDDEIKIINNVLDYESLAEKYNPYISDPVKGTYKDGVSDEEFREYMELWIKQFFKYPITYVKATLQQNYAILSLPLRNQIFYTNSNVISSENLIITESAIQGKLNDRLISFYSIVDYIPFLNIFCCSSFYCMMLFVLSAFCIYFRRWKMFIPLFPMWIQFLICIASPAIINHPRYTFPIVYSIPFLWGYFMVLNPKEVIRHAEKYNMLDEK